MLKSRMKAVQPTGPCCPARTRPGHSFARTDRAQQELRRAGQQEAHAEEVAGRRIRKARAAGGGLGSCHASQAAVRPEDHSRMEPAVDKHPEDTVEGSRILGWGSLHMQEDTARIQAALELDTAEAGGRMPGDVVGADIVHEPAVHSGADGWDVHAIALG